MKIQPQEVLQNEVDASYIYEQLSIKEEIKEIKKIFFELSKIEMSHTHTMQKNMIKK
jgi:rubrerythrin